MSKPFQFKQFAVRQDKCAMKIGTDGVLLGAWANVENATSILDIGTGTGLIALMAAQRNLNAQIIAIEIDEIAAKQAHQNVLNSKWSSRIKVVHQSLQELTKINKDQFDCIISNPPFFAPSEIEMERERKIARQSNTLTIKTLAKSVSHLLTENGRASFIFPFDRREEFVEVFEKHQLFLAREQVVKGSLASPPKRVLLEFSKTMGEIKELLNLVIEPTARHQYSKEYINLTKEFYLKM